MARGGVVGCLVRFNEVLMGDTDIPYSFECSVDIDDVEDYGDIEWVAEASAEELSDLLGVDLVAGAEVHWEYIGRRFNLYSYPLLADSTRVGEIRVVETGGFVVNTSGALGVELEGLAGEAVEELRTRRVVERGQVLGPVYLEPGSSIDEAPGQVVIPRFVVYAVEGVPVIDPASWRLVVRGDVAGEAVFTYERLAEMSSELGGHVFHCVTGWSTRPRGWRGVALSEILEEAGVSKTARWLAARSASGYASIAPLDVAMKEGILVTHIDGKPLSREHGFPARLFFPSLYGWKAAKWVKEIIVLDHYEDGFWETLAYHERGLVLAEERFKIRNPVVASMKKLPPIARKLVPRSSKEVHSS